MTRRGDRGIRRRLVAAGVVLALAAGGFTAYRITRPRVKTDVLGVQITPAPVPFAGHLPEDARRGLRYTGLKLNPACGFALGLIKTGLCSHGPDPAPEGVDVKAGRTPSRWTGADAGDDGSPERATFAAAGQVVCDGDGVSGKRVQAIYAHPPGTDRHSQFLASFRTWAGQIDAAFDASAAETAGSRHVRFVTNACALVVDNVAVSAAAASDFDTTIDELRAQGYTRTDRAYLIWMDADTYCGIGTMWMDDSPGATNRNNAGPSYARTDSGCWGRTDFGQGSVEAHELMHNLGGVQNSAPHTTGGHCFDENDRMCYSDGTGIPMQTLCSDAAHDRLFDCNHDDYFYAGTPPPTSYLATHWNAANNDFLIRSTPVAGTYTPLTPARILDTRTGLGGARLGAGATIDVQVNGRGGVPTTGVSAVALNVTVTNPTAGSFLTVFPTGVLRPNASNLNFVPGQTVPNLVVAKIGDLGKVSVFNAAGAADVIFDVAGWFSDSSSGASGRYRPLTPARILDTRSGTRIGADSTRDVQVTGAGQVPSSGVSGVVLNVTAVNPSASGFLTVFPTGSSRPLASNLNFTKGQTVPNRVFAKLGTGGKVTLYNSAGTTDVIVDVAGWFTDASGSSTPPGLLTALAPARILDTRSSSKVGSGASIDVPVGGLGGVPGTGASAVVLNVTVTNPTAAGFLTVWPTGVSRPVASDLNFLPGESIPNLVVVKLGTGGKVSVFNSGGTTDVIFDVVGWLS